MTKEEILNGMSEEEFYRLYPTKDAWEKASKMKLGGLSGAPHNGQPTADQFFNYGSHANDKLNIPMSNPFFLKEGGTYYGGPLRPYQPGGSLTPQQVAAADQAFGRLDHYSIRGQDDEKASAAYKAEIENLYNNPKYDIVSKVDSLNKVYPNVAEGFDEVSWNTVFNPNKNYNKNLIYKKQNVSGASLDYLKKNDLESLKKFENRANPYFINADYKKQGGSTYPMAYGGDITEFCWGGGLPGGPNEMPEMLHGGYHSPMNYGSFPATEWGGALDPSNMDSYPMMEGGGDPFIFRKLQAGRTDLPYMTDKDTGLDPGLKMRSTGFTFNKLQPGKPNLPTMNVKDTGFNQSNFNFRQLPAERPVMSDMNVQDAPMGRPGFNYRNLPAQNPDMPFMNTPDTKLADIIKSASKSMKKKGGKTTVQGGNQNFLKNRRAAFDDALTNNVYNAFIQEEEKAAMQALNPYATGMEDQDMGYKARKGKQKDADVPIKFGKDFQDIFPSGRDYSAYIPGEMRSDYYMSNADYARMAELNKRLGDKSFELTGFKPTVEYGPMARLLGKTGRRFFGPKAVTYEFTGRGSKQVPIKDTDLYLKNFEGKNLGTFKPGTMTKTAGSGMGAMELEELERQQAGPSFYYPKKESLLKKPYWAGMESDPENFMNYSDENIQTTPTKKSDENIQLDPSKIRTGPSDQATQQKIEDLNRRLNNKKYGGLNTYQGGGPQIGYQQYQELMNAYNAANAATGSDKGDKTLAFQKLYHQYLPENARQLIQSRGSATAMGKSLGAPNEFSLESNQDRKFGKTTKAYGQSLQDMGSMFKPQDQMNYLKPEQPNMPYMDMQDPGINFPSTQPQPGFQFNKLAGDVPTMGSMDVTDPGGMGNFKYTAPTANLASSSSTTPKTQMNTLPAGKTTMGNLTSEDPFLKSLSGMSDADKMKAIKDRAKNFPTGKLTPGKPELKDLTETELGPEEKLGAKIKRKTKGIGKAIGQYAPGAANWIASNLEQKPELDPMQNQPIVLGNRGDYRDAEGMGEFRPDQQVPVQFPGGIGAYRTKFGGALPQALSGLEVKMQPGLYGTNGNRQFSLPTQIDSQKYAQQPTEVRNSLTAVPRDQANLEAEGGETALVNIDGIPAHFKISGKRHSQGGVPLDLPDNSFIYSDTASMKIKDPNILAQFGMAPKKGGYTPAEIAKKYDINKYRKILSDPNSEDLERKTAESMIANNNMKLAKLAMAQESLKGFPQGIPVVAMPYMIANDIDPAMYAPTQAQEEQPDDDMGVQRYGGNIVAQYPTMRYGGLTEYQKAGQTTDDLYGFSQTNKNIDKMLEVQTLQKQKEGKEKYYKNYNKAMYTAEKQHEFLKNQVDKNLKTIADKYKEAIEQIRRDNTYNGRVRLDETALERIKGLQENINKTVETYKTFKNKLSDPTAVINKEDIPYDFVYKPMAGPNSSVIGYEDIIKNQRVLQSRHERQNPKDFKNNPQLQNQIMQGMGVVDPYTFKPVKYPMMPTPIPGGERMFKEEPVVEEVPAVQNVEVKKKPAATKTATGSSKPKKDWSKYEIKE